uniref:DUF3089 domain-containing protein n=1 Tax=uncultured Nocardioidaceae bacterium TaxID=253824 RepID=A0A6J4MJV9_9ACTN|nr:MAG: hypothetical protein AVDCRST_MAG46-3025 [uncultured Nocardioidaceae bacterium]
MRPPRIVAATLVTCAALLLGACTSDDTPPRPRDTTTATTTPTTPEPETPPGRAPVWLCRPDMRANPCEGDLDTTVVAADGTRTREAFRPAADPAFDCFYVYPTVSEAPRTNAPLRVTPELEYVVRAQAALFARECRVFAPVYRQLTLQGLITGFADSEARDLAQTDVVNAWHQYLRRWNDGRPFLLLGHSQGTFALTTLVAEEIDDDPALRDRMVSAMLLGGAVTVLPGESAGGVFDNVPACGSLAQTGCVVAYNTFAQMPSNPSLFGRAGEGQQVLCVNPAAPGGGRGLLTPYVPVESPDGRVTGFTAYEDAVTARCREGDGASWLGVRADDRLPDEVTTSEVGPAWGLHRVDVNIALGDLVDLAAAQAATMR